MAKVHFTQVPSHDTRMQANEPRRIESLENTLHRFFLYRFLKLNYAIYLILVLNGPCNASPHNY